MYIALYVFGAEFQMVPFKSAEGAIQNITKYFDELVEQRQLDPETDEAFVFEVGPYRENMRCVFATRNIEKYSA